MGPPLPADESPSGRTYHRPRATRKALLAAAAAAGIAYAFLRWKPFRVEVAGMSMVPTLEPGDWAVAVSTRLVRPGAVVVIDDPRRPGFEIVKRVVATAGRAPDGTVLGPDELWVEGDAPDASTDSRTFGPVRREGVKGVVRFVYWPLGRWRPVRGG
jgi:nickel-type superoxide dismutase maturation protease